MKKIASVKWCIFFALSVLAVFLSATAYIFLPNVCFPIFNGILFAIWIFIYRGKYRFYAIAFFVPLTRLMSINGSGIGSFVTWIIYVYFVVLAAEYISKALKKAPHIRIDSSRVLAYFLYFFVYLLIVTLVNFNFNVFKGLVSSLAYIALPLSYFLDFKAEKNFKISAYLFAFSVLFSNLFAFSFVYIFDNYTTVFVERYISSYSDVIERYGKDSLRYPGLFGDPNHNALYILFSSSLLAFLLKDKSNKRLPIILLIICLQFFAVIGQSKTYFISILVLFVLSIFIFVPAKKRLFFASLTLICFSAIFFIAISFEDVYKIVVRIIFIDPRKDFLEAITSDRSTIWSVYYEQILSSPLHFLLGRGVESVGAGGMSAHNLLLQMIWEYGILCIPFVSLYYGYLFRIKDIKFNKMFLAPILIICIFGISLHILYDEVIYLMLLIVQCFDINAEEKKLFNVECAFIEYSLEV